MADFQSSGTLELFIKILKSLIKYGIIASPPNFKISLGILSGPHDLRFCNLLILCLTFLALITKGSPKHVISSNSKSPTLSLKTEVKCKFNKPAYLQLKIKKNRSLSQMLEHPVLNMEIETLYLFFCNMLVKTNVFIFAINFDLSYEDGKSKST
jgi:hypothetical protein